MNNTYTQFIQDKTLSNVSLILTTAGFLVFTVGQLNNFNGQQSITPSSASLSFNYAQNGQAKAINQLEANLAELWNDVDSGNFVATEQELEVAKLMLNKFPDNNI